MHGEPLETDVQERFFEYQVNVLVSNRGQDQAPVVIESAPTYRNLFGTVDRIVDRLVRAPGNGAPIGGLKVTTANGWFAARPSGTENVYKIYAESFLGAAHLERRNRAHDVLGDVRWVHRLQPARPHAIPCGRRRG